MQQFDHKTVETLLSVLDDKSYLFPQFGLLKVNNEIQYIGRGGFSSVYEMYNKERPSLHFVLKVNGLEKHTVSSSEFWNTGRIQWLLCQDSKYIVRILDTRELFILLDDNNNIFEIIDGKKENKEEDEKYLHLQFTLMEKLDELLIKDKFRNVKLKRNELANENEVITFALEIGQAISSAHNNNFLHRDIKLENIFWDEIEKIYKLGDFGIAKYAEDGNAETIVYTDGYGAPEIERRLYDHYNATADIYSFGITLYLLLNDLRFPGSEGYYSKVEVQYNPLFIFPAPAHASEEMTRIIRKMCSYRTEDRYQSMAEVLINLRKISDSRNLETSGELLDLVDLVTETYREEKNEKEEKCSEKRKKTRAERKIDQQIDNSLYREDSAKYFVTLTLLMTLLFGGMQSDTNIMLNWLFLILPIAILFEAILQKIEDFHFIVGTLVIVFAGYSIYSIGLTFPHIILIMCVFIGCPLLSVAGSLSTCLWIFMSQNTNISIFDFLVKNDLGWIILIIVMIVINRYLQMKIDYNKITYKRAILGVYIYDKIFLIMILVGIILFILQKCKVLVLPDIINRIHFIRTGIICFAIMMIFYWLDGYTKDNDITDGDSTEVEIK